MTDHTTSDSARPDHTNNETPTRVRVGYTSSGQFEVHPRPKGPKERSDYARLFTASGDLLAALRFARNQIEVLDPGYHDGGTPAAIEAIDFAIAKAEGGAQ